MQTFLLNRIIKYQKAIESWLTTYEKSEKIPLYLSTDIRDAEFKTSVVDSNLFPAGFNNICEADLDQAATIFRQRVLSHNPNAKTILLIMEEHTRNKWYLENIHTLKIIIIKAGFEVTITTSRAEIFENAQEITLISEKKQSLSILNPTIALTKESNTKFDFVVLNHDLINDIPYLLQQANLETNPSMYAGWHSRLKSKHFIFEEQLLKEFCSITKLDPWFFSCLDISVNSMNINEEVDRNTLSECASELFSQIQKKYDQYRINSNPFIFLKANYGTYGMGVLSVSNPSQIQELNRKMRNKLYKGKGTSVITSFLLQEGIPSIHKVDQMSAEVCLYQISNQYIGSFYRIHENKTDLENLNSPGMQFRSIGRDINAPCGDTLDKDLLYSYQILSRIAGVACMKEIEEIEKQSKKYEVCISH